MKSLHFCTPKLVQFIRESEVGENIFTFRTGWTPNIYQRDIIACYERREELSRNVLRANRPSLNYLRTNDLFLHGGILYEMACEEVARYHRVFHHDHPFYQICLKKLGDDQTKIELVLNALGGATDG